MADTMKANVFDPIVWGDMAQAEFKTRAVVATTDAVMTADTLAGQPGSTIRFPRFAALADMTNIAENASIVPETLSQEASEATIKEAAKGVAYTDLADLAGLGDIETEAVRQFGVLAARKVDADLIAAATATVTGGITVQGGTARDSAPISHALNGATLTWSGIVDALEKFGDDFEPSEFSGLFIRAEQRSQIMKDDTFIHASELQAGGDGSIVGRGFIGEVAGLPVYVTNRLDAKNFLILKKNSLGLLYKRRPQVERDRDILARKNIVTINMHYAVKRLTDTGVLVGSLK